MGNNEIQQAIEIGANQLAKSGRTDSPEVNTSLQAAHLIQSRMAEGQTPQEIAASAKGLSGKVQAELEQQLLTATTDIPLTGSQLVAAGILQLAPILIGAAHSGKRGVAIGAESGFVGSGSFIKEAKATNENTKAAAGLRAKMLQGQLESLGKQQMDAQKMGMTQDFTKEQNQFKRDTTLGAASIRARGEVDAAGLVGGKLPAAAVSAVTQSSAAAEQSSAVADALLALPSGGIENYATWLAKTQVSGSKEWLANQQLESLKNSLVEAKNTGAPSNKDVDRLLNELAGKQFYPANPRELAQLVKLAENGLRRNVISTIDTFKELQSGGGVEALVERNKQAIEQNKELFGNPDYDPSVQAPPMFSVGQKVKVTR